ncbi:MAG TPA: hypothetical protein VJH22_04135 [Candidatus Nanoarchaeia archaeon]|nr:hypothetical protein [Candidatus Nanoarchaeia archaeon]
MALLDELTKTAPKDQDPVRQAVDHKKLEDTERDPFVAKVQTSINKAWAGLDKILAGSFIPEDKRSDPTFNVADVTLKGKKTEIYRTLNSFVEIYLREIVTANSEKHELAGAIVSGQMIKDGEARFKYFFELIEKHVGADSKKDHDPASNPTLVRLLSLAEQYSKDPKAKVRDLKEAIRVYAHSPSFASFTFNEITEAWLDNRLKSYHAENLGVNTFNRLKDKGWSLVNPDDATALINPNNDKKLYVNLVRALNDGNLRAAEAIGNQLGLKYQANLN